MDKITIKYQNSRETLKYRFFIWDIKKRKIISSGLCCHGDCKSDLGTSVPKKFSNQINSYCSSLGVYQVGRRDLLSYSQYTKDFGKYKYWLIGLDHMNNKAVNRGIVLHVDIAGIGGRKMLLPGEIPEDR